MGSPLGVFHPKWKASGENSLSNSMQMDWLGKACTEKGSSHLRVVISERLKIIESAILTFHGT